MLPPDGRSQRTTITGTGLLEVQAPPFEGNLPCNCTCWQHGDFHECSYQMVPVFVPERVA